MTVWGHKCSSHFHDVLHDMTSSFTFVYLDDILVFFRTLNLHIQHVRQVLQRPLENQPFVKAKKTNFTSPLFSSWGLLSHLEMASAKTRDVTNWPTPTPHKELQHFLGFMLNALTSVKITFCWPPHAAFQYVSRPRQCFTSVSVLTLLDTEKQFSLEVDDTRIQTVLLQWATDSEIHICLFLPAPVLRESNYSVGDCELLAMKLALKNAITCGSPQPGVLNQP